MLNRLVQLTYEAVRAGQGAPLVQAVRVGSIRQRLALSGQRGAVVLRHRRHPGAQGRPRQAPPLDQGEGGAQAAAAATQRLCDVGRGGW